ncbi:hypothetical protein EVAR_61398_1 [Eumeta japonica]|uniref:Uncharacterized protein n=1 Tax=Eumeta variegata TaxID=151549 RepID=A0A4C1ZAK1_EUMVA|nr:hypothetical protein EVAR_61398_1 [Eumeta japonica]
MYKYELRTDEPFVKCLLYADGQVILAPSACGLQEMNSASITEAEAASVVRPSTFMNNDGNRTRYRRRRAYSAAATAGGNKRLDPSRRRRTTRSSVLNLLQLLLANYLHNKDLPDLSRAGADKAAPSRLF